MEWRSRDQESNSEGVYKDSFINDHLLPREFMWVVCDERQWWSDKCLLETEKRIHGTERTRGREHGTKEDGYW